MARRTGRAWRARIEEYTAKLTEHRRCVWLCRACADALLSKPPSMSTNLSGSDQSLTSRNWLTCLKAGARPFLTLAALEQIGFRIVIYGISLLVHAVRAMENVLGSLSHGKVDFAGKASNLRITNQSWASSNRCRLKRTINRAWH